MEKNKNTLQRYDEIALDYVHLNQNNKNIEKYRKIFRQFLLGSNIIDIGCGTGRDVHYFNQNDLNIIGYDGSKGMLEQAKKLYPKEKFKLLNLLNDEWSIKSNLDGVWACASLLHFTEKEFEKIFGKVLSLLNQKGIFYFSLKLDDTINNKEINGRWFQYYTKDYLDNFIENFNCKILYEDINEHNGEKFINYIITKK